MNRLTTTHGGCTWARGLALGQAFRFVDIANDVNEHMPDYVVSRAVEFLNRNHKAVNGSTIVLVGLAYKRNSGDVRNSPAMVVAKRLASLGARLRAIDPLISGGDVPVNVDMVPCEREQLAEADLVIVLTDHDDLDWALARRTGRTGTGHAKPAALDGSERL